MQSGQIPQNNVIYVTVPPANGQTVQVSQPSNVQINASSHRAMAILEFITAIIIFLLEVIALSLKSNYVVVMGTGIWFAPFIFVTGLLGYFGGVKNNKCLIVSCMVMAIITCCLTVIAMSFYSIELSTTNYYFTIFHSIYGNYAGFNSTKNVIGDIAAVFIFFLTIVQSIFCCKDVCSCCHQNISQSGIIIPQQQQQQAIIIQHQQMQPTGYPLQQSYVYPQQQQIYSPQPSQVVYPMQAGNNYPQQSQVYSVQAANNYTQPSHEYFGAGGVMPPSYLDATTPYNSEASRKS